MGAMNFFKGTVYVQGLNFSIFIFFHKNKVFTAAFQTKKIIKKEQIFAEKLGKGVWVQCLFVCLGNFFFFKCCFHKVYLCLEGATFKSYNSRAIYSIPIKIGQLLD